jgi:hypothetical protein
LEVSPEPLSTSVFRLTSVFTPCDQVIAALQVGESAFAVDRDQHRRAMGGEGDVARAPQLHVVEAAGERAGGTLDALDVSVDAVVEGQHVRPVGGDRLVVEAQQPDVLGDI